MQWPSPLRNARGRPRPGRGDKTSVSLTVHRSRNWHVRYSSRSQSPQASDHADGGVGEFRVRCDEITSRQFRNALSHEGLQGPARSLTRVAPSLRAARAPVAPEPIRARCIPSHTPQTAADEPAKGPEHLADSGPQEGGGAPPPSTCNGPRHSVTHEVGLGPDVATRHRSH